MAAEGMTCSARGAGRRHLCARFCRTSGSLGRNHSYFIICDPRPVAGTDGNRRGPWGQAGSVHGRGRSQRPRHWCPICPRWQACHCLAMVLVALCSSLGKTSPSGYGIVPSPPPTGLVILKKRCTGVPTPQRVKLLLPDCLPQGGRCWRATGSRGGSRERPSSCWRPHTSCPSLGVGLGPFSLPGQQKPARAALLSPATDCLGRAPCQSCGCWGFAGDAQSPHPGCGPGASACEGPPAGQGLTHLRSTRPWQAQLGARGGAGSPWAASLTLGLGPVGLRDTEEPLPEPQFPISKMGTWSLSLGSVEEPGASYP